MPVRQLYHTEDKKRTPNSSYSKGKTNILIYKFSQSLS